MRCIVWTKNPCNLRYSGLGQTSGSVCNMLIVVQYGVWVYNTHSIQYLWNTNVSTCYGWLPLAQPQLLDTGNMLFAPACSSMWMASFSDFCIPRVTGEANRIPRWQVPSEVPTGSWYACCSRDLAACSCQMCQWAKTPASWSLHLWEFQAYPALKKTRMKWDSNFSQLGSS